MRRSTSLCRSPQLTPAERTIVAIARPSTAGRIPEGLLILDEPTAALHSDEVGRLFTAIRRVAGPRSRRHFRVAPPRRGHGPRRSRCRPARRPRGRRHARRGARPRRARAAHRRLGARARRHHTGSATSATSALRVRGLAGGTVADLDLDVRTGEVVGVSGILGSGREQWRRCCSGRCPAPWARSAVARRRARARRPARGDRRRRRLRPGRPPRRRRGDDDARARKHDAAEPAAPAPAPRVARRPGRAPRRRRVGRARSSCGRPTPSGRWSCSAAATSRRSCWRSGCATTRGCCCSTSRRRASTSAPRRRSTAGPRRGGARRGRPDGVVGHRRSSHRYATASSSCATGRAAAEVAAATSPRSGL